MGTPTFLQFALNGHKMGELKRVCASAVAAAEDIGAEDIKGTACASVKRMMGKDGQKPPRYSLIEHEVMSAMAGMDLPLDFIDQAPETE